MVHFSHDINKKEREEYLKQYPLFKVGEDGLLQRRTYLYVLKIRHVVNGEEQNEGNTCEAGYNYVTGELLGWTWLCCIIYGIYKLVKKFKLE